MKHATRVRGLALLGLLLATGSPGQLGAHQRESTATIVGAIVRADYEADRSALLRLFNSLTPPSTDAAASRIRYWRGFARWRRAINGVNDGADVSEMREDLRVATEEFDDAAALDAGFVDARAALLSSLGLQLFLGVDDAAARQTIIDRVRPLLAALRAAPQDHPRMMWVLGQIDWRTPPDWPADRVRAHQDGVIATYERALDLARRQRGIEQDDLEPRWGEPELLMNLAWSHLNKTAPDLAAADLYAREALRLVPHWHYVRDILLPQIEKARHP